MEHKLEVGDIVKPINPENVLRSGCELYEDAVVISLDPFVLSSRGADMRWSATVSPEKFTKIGEADTELLTKAQTRINK